MENTIYMYDLYRHKLVDSGTLEELTTKYKALSRRRIKGSLKNDFRYDGALYFSYFPPSAFTVRDLQKKKAIKVFMD